MMMKDAVVLITGASRGLGVTYAEQALARGARKVYASARTPQASANPAVVPLKLDITSPTDIAAAVEHARDVTVVINNAAIALPGGLLGPEGQEALRQQFETNVFGTLQVSQAFAPTLAQNGGGAIINMLSALSWTNFPSLSGYCVSKSAAWGVTMALRNELRSAGTQVLAVHAAFIDTDMARGFDGPKSSPLSVVDQVYDALEAGLDEVLADDVTRRLKASLAAPA